MNLISALPISVAQFEDAVAALDIDVSKGIDTDTAFAITMWLEAQKYGESQTGVRS